MRRPIRTAAACALMLTGCQNAGGPGPNTAGGALLGAASGAALGTLAGGDDRRNALIGAGIGLLAGTAVGAYMDEQERRLARDLSGTDARVDAQGDRLVVTLPGGVTFDTDSTTINPGFRRPLDRVAETLKAYPSSYLDVIGHTDSTGSESYNQDLSERRAASVAAYLERRGVFPGRIATFGMGERAPVATNDTAAGRQANRRVELEIIPAEEPVSG